MDQSRTTVGQKIAQTVREIERRHMRHRRDWVAVFLNEETVVIAVHGILTAAESAIADTSAELREFQQRLFANIALVQRIESLSGMGVLDTTVELDPTTGDLALLFRTDTAGAGFPALARPGRNSSRLDRHRLSGPMAGPAAPNQPDVSSGDDRPRLDNRSSR
ncbi:Na-translocating system protein MpsC family protein [Limnoglobus roseus]|uniref:Na+-translocating membrane potential-generating system MpsC domain-containing protein n=1 Tax=Limnoglobus roseus TaxID=2598579 RepID=A0A5C1ASI0_9BACT|nr:Na-translocating system protein MpsC family protein [Limnoglobus roseus]QEL19858.1 hypothetical protein PX52LOC_06939 [Limnoglobus roseus]